MENIILCTTVFALSFIGRLILYLISKKRKKKNAKKLGVGTDILYLIKKFKLDEKKVDKMSIATIVSILDALIITVAFYTSIVITDNILLEMLIGLVVIIVLILVINEIFGRILVKKGYEKNEL